MAKKKKTKHIPLSVLVKRYNRGPAQHAKLGRIIEQRKKHPTDPNDRK